VAIWISVATTYQRGQGGPTMVAEQIVEFGRLGLDVWWDIYFDATAKNS
jgi:hypothetical protein